MDIAGSWGHVEVQGSIMIPNVGESLIEELHLATKEAVSILNNQMREPFPGLPSGVFYIHVLQGWPGIRADVRERGLHEHMAKGSSFFDGVVASALAENRIGQDPVSSALIVDLLFELPRCVSNAWSGWLKWRMRRRYKPDWLEEFRQRKH